MLFYDVVR